jgi:hypothetical protein
VIAEGAVPLALMVVVNARVSPPVVAVRALSSREGGHVVGEVMGVLDAGDADLRAAIARGAARLLDTLGHPAWARVVVRAEPPSSVLRVAEPAAAQLESSLAVWIPPGEAALWIEAPGHHPREIVLSLGAGEDRALDVRLEPDAAWWRSPWLWAAVGVGVAAGVTAAALTLTGGERCLCVGHPSAPCACP